jgi:hypothetical protein
MMKTKEKKIKTDMRYAVWEDETYGFSYGTVEMSKGRKIVKYCKDYDEARIAWKWYYYNP